LNLKKLQSIIEKIGEETPPKDDWMPVLILEGRKEVTVYGFIGKPMEGEYAKNSTARKITESIAAFKPDVACFITTAWSLDFEKGGISERDVEAYMSGAIKIANHPARVEIVNAYVYGVRGSNKGEALMIGYIQRHPDKGPTIKEWKVIKEGASAEGRFPDAVKEGFQLAGLLKGVE
jgi:hypothetical protein